MSVALQESERPQDGLLDWLQCWCKLDWLIQLYSSAVFSREKDNDELSEDSWGREGGEERDRERFVMILSCRKNEERWSVMDSGGFLRCDGLSADDMMHWWGTCVGLSLVVQESWVNSDGWRIIRHFLCYSHFPKGTWLVIMLTWAARSLWYQATVQPVAEMIGCMGFSIHTNALCPLWESKSSQWKWVLPLYPTGLGCTLSGWNMATGSDHGHSGQRLWFPSGVSGAALHSALQRICTYSIYDRDHIRPHYTNWTRQEFGHQSSRIMCPVKNTNRVTKKKPIKHMATDAWHKHQQQNWSKWTKCD